MPELSAEWIKVPDGNGGQRKVWLRDSKARKEIDTLNTTVNGMKIAGIVTQTLGSHSNTSANAWEYTGFSITVPAGHLYIAKIMTGWTSGKPTGLGVNQSTSLTGGIPAIIHTNTDAIFETPALFLQPGTWYVYSKRASVSTSANNYFVRYIDIPALTT